MADLTPESVLRITDDVPYVLREGAESVDLLLPGKSLGLPKLCRGAFERLQKGPVRLGDLVEFSEPDRELFVKALVREGLLRICEP